jgi:recombination protein RecR
MPDYAEPIARLIQNLKRLPSVGQKSAERMAFHIMNTWSREDAQGLADAVLEVKDKIGYCSICNNITDVDPCHYCSNPSRSPKLVCVVQLPHNIMAIEKTRQFNGHYHVLMGALSPLSGVGPDQLRIKGLLERLKSGLIEEIILATNPNTEGEATAVYLSKLLKPLGVKVTRIAMGIPVGSDLDYADEVTMSKALEGRRDL